MPKWVSCTAWCKILCNISTLFVHLIKYVELECAFKAVSMLNAECFQLEFIDWLCRRLIIDGELQYTLCRAVPSSCDDFNFRFRLNDNKWRPLKAASQYLMTYRLGVNRLAKNSPVMWFHVNWTKNCCAPLRYPNTCLRLTVAHAFVLSLPKIQIRLNTISSWFNIWIRSNSDLMCWSQVGTKV